MHVLDRAFHALTVMALKIFRLLLAGYGRSVPHACHKSLTAPL